MGKKKSKKRKFGLYRCGFCGDTKEYEKDDNSVVCMACGNEEANWVFVEEL